MPWLVQVWLDVSKQVWTPGKLSSSAHFTHQFFACAKEFPTQYSVIIHQISCGSFGCFECEGTFISGKYKKAHMTSEYSNAESESAVSCYEYISRLSKLCNTSCSILAVKLMQMVQYVPSATMPLLGVQWSWCTSSYFKSFQYYTVKNGTRCQSTLPI